MAGLEERMLGWPEFRNPRDRYAYSSPEAIGEIIPGIRDLLHRYDDPVEISSGPYIPSEDTSEIVPLVESSGGGITGMKDEIPRYMNPITGDMEVAGLFDRLKSGGSGGGVPETKNKWGVLDSKLVESGDMTLQEFIEKWGINPSDYEQLPQAFAKPGQSPGDDRSKDPYDKDWPAPAPLAPKLAHVNKTGTAHDWQDPNHGGIRVPGGTVNPHGQRGGLTYPDGRAKYSQEEVLQMMKDGKIDPNSYKWDDRFWPADSRPGDGSNLTPEAQKLYDSIFSEDLNSGLGKSPKLASNVVGYEDWTIDGPREQGPIPALQNTRSIDQGKLKSLMDELRDMRLRGVL
tara:strand:+ start:7746 stop:8777 length:1032 start_codon:yes stop_codon:yes gene_type:complete